MARARSGFTMIELLVVTAVLSLLVALALPAYLGVRNEAAIDEGNSMADEWRVLAWACYIQNLNNVGYCLSDSNIGFQEPAPGKYWNWISGTDSYNLVLTHLTATTIIGIQVQWPSTNSGLENGETFVVTMPVVGGQNVGRATTSCLPAGC